MRLSNAVYLLIGAGIVAALRKPIIVHIHVESPKIDTNSVQLNNEPIRWTDDEVLDDDIENEPIAEEKLKEAIDLIQPGMGAWRAETLRQAIWVLASDFVQWSREQYKTSFNTTGKE